MTSRVTGTNLRGVKALAKRFPGGKYGVRIGVPTGPTESDGTKLVDVAMWLEFGIPGKTPERSFLRAGIRNNLGKFKQLNVKSLQRIARGNLTIDDGLGRLGAVAAGAVKKEFRSGNMAPNAASTIASKGSSTPGIDSGNLVQSITWQMEGGQGDASDARSSSATETFFDTRKETSGRGFAGTELL